MKSLRGRSLIKRFYRERRGATIVVFALLLVVVMAFVGGSVDFLRAYSARTKMQAAIDAGVLAAAAKSSMTNDERLAYAQQVFAANYPESKFGVTGEPVITIDSNGRIVGSVSANVESAFLGVIGIDKLDIAASSEAQSAVLAKGEIVLVLDYSGSMDHDGKYQSMRDAAVGMINLLSQNGENKDVKFGLVPFSDHVYGTMQSDFIVNEAPGGWWTNCTRDRKWSYNIQDSTPVASIDASKWGMTCESGGGEEDEEGEEGGGCNPYSACSAYPSRNLIIQPLTDDHAGLITQLNAMTPHSYTHISLGMAMGWHLLSPNPPWEEGVAYGTKDVLKVVVLLTDGQQTTNAWGPSDSSSVSNAEDNLEDMCQAIKAQDVTVITVAFDLDDPDTENRLRDCATSPAHFFTDIDTGDELVAVFNAIAEKLAGELRLTK